MVPHARMRLAALALSLAVMTPAVAVADGETVAREFVNALKAGDVARAKNLFDTQYRWLPRGGIDAFFRYESAHEPNLTFLLGQSFEAGNAIVNNPIRSEWYFLDGVRGVNLTVPLRFDGERAPFLLPVPIAFGRSMEFGAFMNFVKHPESHRFEALTLRLRPSVAPGLIAPPSTRMMEVPAPPGPIVKAPPPPVPGGEQRRPAMVMPAPGSEGGLLGGEHPRDPGAVVLPSGEALTLEQLATLLPRLRAIDIVFTVMQRGRFASWKSEGVALGNPLVVSDGAENRLR